MCVGMLMAMIIRSGGFVETNGIGLSIARINKKPKEDINSHTWSWITITCFKI